MRNEIEKKIGATDSGVCNKFEQAVKGLMWLTYLFVTGKVDSMNCGVMRSSDL